ncbi:winged helix-turn-helix domain-containing protein [Mesorhizobium mediterraneum]|uniref:winged helix-turn-helix domain-containing protein n=1 Tax=Mesorhizobium mediterraneum TaxID=43617 RepID=UPI00178245FC|nr:winged helix-turn-helix domain-containing protein [Mesorhizobium mediterraneum]
MNLRVPRTIAVNGVMVDVAGGFVRDRDGREIPLRPQAFDLLIYLLENAGRLVSKDELMKAVWPNVFVTDDSLVQCVRDVRRAIGDENQSVLKAVPKRGYRLAVGVADPPSARTRWRMGAVAASVLVLVAVGLVWRYARPPAELRSFDGPPVVALVPFIDFGGDEAARKLAVEMKKSLGNLGRLREFQIVVRDSAYAYGLNPGETVDVDFVLGASISREGDSLRITAHLIDPSTGGILWSERWDRRDDDIFAVQSEICERISNRLGGSAGLIQETARAAARLKAPGQVTAYELYLLGAAKLARINRADVEEAVDLLSRSAEREPGLVRTWVELSLAHDLMADFGVEPELNRMAAADAAERAVSLEPTDPKAHAALGMSLRHRGEIARTRSEFDTALAIAPDAFEILALYAGWASSFGEAQRGAEMADRAVRLVPDFPDWSAKQFSNAYFMVGRYEDALGMLDRLSPDNDTISTRTTRAAALAVVSQNKEAREWVGKAIAAHPSSPEGSAPAGMPVETAAGRTSLVNFHRSFGERSAIARYLRKD